MNNKYLRIAPLFVALSTGSVAHAQNTFDAATDLTNNFVVAGGYTHNASGFVSLTNRGGATSNTSFSLDLSQDQNVSISADFFASTIYTNNRNFTLGLTAVDPAVTPVDYAGGGLYNNLSIAGGIRSVETTAFGTYYGFGDSFTSFDETASGDVLSAGWYNLTLNLTYDDTANTFIGETVISTTAGAPISTNTFANQLANPYGADATVDFYSFFATYDGIAAGVTAVDNFNVVTAVPEPSSYALLAGALALGSIMMRRRK